MITQVWCRETYVLGLRGSITLKIEDSIILGVYAFRTLCSKYALGVYVFSQLKSDIMVLSTAEISVGELKTHETLLRALDRVPRFQAGIW